MLYSEDLIGEILAANDIVDVIGAYVSLKKSGSGQIGLCPFHSEKTPSFHVSPDKQLYHCFGCGEGGNVLTFIMKAENLDFVEGIKYLADRAHIALPEPDSGANADKQYKKKQRLISANTCAAKFFYSSLMSEKGSAGREYFKKREISLKTVTGFGLGFAPDAKDELIKHMKQMGYGESELVDFGLAIIRDNKYIDKFRNRVIFPIIDVRGNVIGFGGRVMDDSKPKYLNSPETAVFNKRLNLFALNFAKNRQSDTLILVEGYMDVISLHQVGINNTVATLGTALTEEQSKIIARYAKNVVLCYDTDEAGVKATMRAIEIFSKTDCRVKVLSLAGAKDPDEYIKAHGGGSEAFNAALKKALPATLFRINMLKRNYDIDNNIDDKVAFISEASKILSSVGSIEADTYIDMLAKNYDIKRESIYSEMKKLKDRRQTQEERRIVRNSASAGLTTRAIVEKDNKKTVSKRPLISPVENAEKKLLALMFSSRAAAKTAEKEIGAYTYSNPLHQKLAEICLKEWENGAPALSNIVERIDEDERGYVTEIFMKSAVYDDEIDAVKQLIITIKKEKLKKQISEEKDPTVLVKLLKEQAYLKGKRGGEPI